MAALSSSLASVEATCPILGPATLTLFETAIVAGGATGGP